MANLLQAVSSDISPEGDVFIALTWEPEPGVAGYNIYRHTVGSSAQPRRVNGNRVVRAAASCTELKRSVTPGSREWSIISSALTKIAVQADPAVAPVDPCAAFDNGLAPADGAILDAIASASLAIRLARGTAFVDYRVANGRQYTYELRGVRADGTEVVLAQGVGVTAGTFTLPDPPSGIGATVGDGAVLTLWNRSPWASSYVVQRAVTIGGPYLTVNPVPIVFDVTQDIAGQKITPARPGFLDLQQWTPAGTPDTHVVDGVTVDGPANGTTYQYRVASRDILDRAGPWSSLVAATPKRSTPPMAPDQIQVAGQDPSQGIRVSWRTVTRDVANHMLPDFTQTYQVYRSPDRALLEDLSSLSTLMVGTSVANPLDLTVATQTWQDLDPALVPPFGEQTFYYRLTCSDPFGNTSAPSAIASGFVPDVRAPGPTYPDGAAGFPDHITVVWQPNTEPDLAGYQVYRAVCDAGELYIPKNQYGERLGRCDLTFVGQVTVGDAEEMYAKDHRIELDDFSVPADSPLCYAYWVRAYDVAGNLYDGDRGCPKHGETTCMRLLEKTPPPAPILTGLRARSDAVKVEWIAAPVQDLHAFHVYRSDHESDPPKFLGCVFVDGTQQSTPWTGLVPSCKDIPAEPDPLAARGTFFDTTAVPHEIYWYRVSALDWLGNESEASDLTKLPSSSTFTYTNARPVTPVVDAPGVWAGPGCGLDLHWTPAFDPDALEGFVVFRSTSAGPYRQISAIVEGNEFVDLTARAGVAYAYQVQAIDRNGYLSPPSAPVGGSY